MSIFRPSARVTSPDGREWEMYAYKLRLPEGRSGRGGVPRTLRRLYDAAAAGVRAARSDEWTVEAVTYLPHETAYRWTTTREHKGQVLAQVEGHLARGDIPQHLTNGTFRGERRA